MHLNLGNYQIVWLGLDGIKQYCDECHHKHSHYRWRLVWPKLVRPDPDTHLALIYQWLLFMVFFDIRRFAPTPELPEDGQGKETQHD